MSLEMKYYQMPEVNYRTKKATYSATCVLKHFLRSNVKLWSCQRNFILVFGTYTEKFVKLLRSFTVCQVLVIEICDFYETMGKDLTLKTILKRGINLSSCVWVTKFNRFSCHLEKSCGLTVPTYLWIQAIYSILNYTHLSFRNFSSIVLFLGKYWFYCQFRENWNLQECHYKF